MNHIKAHNIGFLTEKWNVGNKISEAHNPESIEDRRELSTQASGPPDPIESEDGPDIEETELEKYLTGNNASIMDMINDLPVDSNLTKIMIDAGIGEHERWKYFKIRGDSSLKLDTDLERHLETLPKDTTDKLTNILIDTLLNAQHGE
jgi:hypothetical protein